MRPHHPTTEAIELTYGEKDKIMNDFLLPEPLDLSGKTMDELHTYAFALSIAYEQCKEVSPEIGKALKELSEMIQQSMKDLFWEGQQLPWKDWSG